MQLSFVIVKQIFAFLAVNVNALFMVHWIVYDVALLHAFATPIAFINLLTLVRWRLHSLLLFTGTLAAFN